MSTLTIGALAAILSAEQGAPQMDSRPPENVYRGELISYPGPWSFELGRSAIILVSDQELEAPYTPLNDP